MEDLIEDLGIRRIFWIQFGITAVSCLGMYLVSTKQVVPFLIGAAVSTVNFGLLTWLWKRVFEKKPVATTLGIIVIKYTALGLLLYALVKGWQVPLLPFFAGLSTLVASFLIVALQVQIQGKSQ